MSKQFLDCPDIRPVVQQMGRETVSQLIWMEFKIVRTPFNQRIKHMTQPPHCERFITVIQPERTTFIDKFFKMSDIFFQARFCRLIKGHYSVLVPFSADFYDPIIKIYSFY